MYISVCAKGRPDFRNGGFLAPCCLRLSLESLQNWAGLGRYCGGGGIAEVAPEPADEGVQALPEQCETRISGSLDLKGTKVKVTWPKSWSSAVTSQWNLKTRYLDEGEGFL